MAQQQQFPSVNSPLVNEDDRTITTTWWQFFLTIWQRTGGGNSIESVPDIQSVMEDTHDDINAPGPFVAQVIGASPFSLLSPGRGTLVISGGTVSQLGLKRYGTTLVLPITAGLVLVERVVDTLIITHTGAPAVTFVPRESGG